MRVNGRRARARRDVSRVLESRSVPRSIGVVTVARSDYGHLQPLLHEIRGAADLELRLLVSGAHLSARLGATAALIEKDGWAIADRVDTGLDDDTPEAIGRALGTAVREFTAALARRRPDVLVVLGDRWEMLAAALAALPLAVPVAHLHGGEVTEGVIDEQIRHALTKLSHLHFAATEPYARRIRQMGEEPWRICVSGEPGLDNMLRLSLGSVADLEKASGLDLARPTALVTFHPPTLDGADLDRQMAEIVVALEAAAARHGLQYLITYPGADPGADRIVDAWKQFVAGRKDRTLVKHLGQRLYLRALKECAMMIGNSSSGLVEVPSYNLPVVNIGDRQAGRVRAANISDCDARSDAIGGAIDLALSYDRTRPCENPYGDGKSAARIVDFIARVLAEKTRAQLLKKKFRDLAAA